MNENYNKHRRNIIIILSIITSILVACSYNSGKDAPKARLVDTTDSCGINDAYYEIQDVDTTNDGYDTDSVIYLDANGNIIKSPLKWVETINYMVVDSLNGAAFLRNLNSPLSHEIFSPE